MELNELPGSELILPGLEDLYHGRNNTIGSLLISISSIRLAAAGLDIPQVSLVSEPELAPYKFDFWQRPVYISSISLKIITKLWGRIFICSSDRRHLIFLYPDNQLDDRQAKVS